MKRADSTHRFLTLVNDFYRDAGREEPVFEFDPHTPIAFGEGVLWRILERPRRPAEDVEPIAAVEVVVEDRSVREEADRADAPSARNPDGSSRY